MQYQVDDFEHEADPGSQPVLDSSSEAHDTRPTAKTPSEVGEWDQFLEPEKGTSSNTGDFATDTTDNLIYEADTESRSVMTASLWAHDNHRRAKSPSEVGEWDHFLEPEKGTASYTGDLATDTFDNLNYEADYESRPTMSTPSWAHDTQPKTKSPSEVGEWDHFLNTEQGASSSTRDFATDTVYNSGGTECLPEISRAERTLVSSPIDCEAFTVQGKHLLSHIRLGYAYSRDEACWAGTVENYEAPFVEKGKVRACPIGHLFEERKAQITEAVESGGTRTLDFMRRYMERPGELSSRHKRKTWMIQKAGLEDIGIRLTQAVRGDSTSRSILEKTTLFDYRDNRAHESRRIIDSVLEGCETSTRAILEEMARTDEKILNQYSQEGAAIIRSEEETTLWGVLFGEKVE